MRSAQAAAAPHVQVAGESSSGDDEEFISAEEAPSDADVAEDSEEHCGLTSDESDAGSVSSYGVGSIYDAEPSESGSSLAEDEPVDEVCSACDDDDLTGEHVDSAAACPWHVFLEIPLEIKYSAGNVVSGNFHGNKVFHRNSFGGN